MARAAGAASAAALFAAVVSATPAAAHAAAPAAAALRATKWPLPPLGWNSWFAYDVDLNETVVRAQADAFVRLGLDKLGFQYINLDGGWQAMSRAPNGSILPDPAKFPSGMPALADYVHSKGLRFGLYTDRGTSTCDGHPGSAGHEAQDAQYYASVGGDFVKSDSCASTMDHAQALALYAEMQQALDATGRDIFFSLCGWLRWYPLASRYPEALGGVGQSWRIGPDALSWENVKFNVDAAADAAPFVGPGKFADVDEVMGPSRKRPINYNQTLTQSAFIAVIGSPLLLSFDLSGLQPSDPDVAPYLNPEFIAIHQDASPAGPQYARVAGGYISTNQITPLTRLPCNASDVRQQWSLLPAAPPPGSGATGNVSYVASLGAPGWCWKAAAAWSNECNNAQEVWVSPCGGASCCGAYCENQLFSFNSDSTVTSLYWPGGNNAAGPYVSVDAMPNSLFLGARFNATTANSSVLPQAPATQEFAFNAKTGLIASQADGTCLGATPRDTTNVWARKLADGSSALLFINFDPAAAHDVTCDAACFAAAGFAPGTSLVVRDIWAMADIGFAAAGAGYTVPALPADGNSRFLKFTPR